MAENTLLSLAEVEALVRTAISEAFAEPAETLRTRSVLNREEKQNLEADARLPSEELVSILWDKIEISFFDAIEIHDFRAAFPTLKSIIALEDGDLDRAAEYVSDWEAEPERRKATQWGSSDPASLSAASQGDAPAGQRALPVEGR